MTATTQHLLHASYIPISGPFTCRLYASRLASSIHLVCACFVLLACSNCCEIATGTGTPYDQQPTWWSDIRWIPHAYGIGILYTIYTIVLLHFFFFFFFSCHHFIWNGVPISHDHQQTKTVIWCGVEFYTCVNYELSILLLCSIRYENSDDFLIIINNNTEICRVDPTLGGALVGAGEGRASGVEGGAVGGLGVSRRR